MAKFVNKSCMDQKLIYKAGVVPFRKTGNGKKLSDIEVLTVSSRKYPGEWVFPVGTVEENESFANAALRECLEESGYVVKLEEPVKEIDSFLLDSGEISFKFIFFQGFVTGENRIWEDDRERRWCGVDEVVQLVARPFRHVAETAVKNI